MKFKTMTVIAALFVTMTAYAAESTGQAPAMTCQLTSNIFENGKEVTRVLDQKAIPANPMPGGSLLGSLEFRNTDIYVTAALNRENTPNGDVLTAFVFGVSPKQTERQSLGSAEYEMPVSRVVVETNAPVAEYGNLRLTCCSQ
ncbi:MAG TPA: hypothetical protein VJB59_01450 [Bdellovibrionota bacterium]|nr:hypothetical protein [Bdellovibrionota bacterium]